jgi:hypothetical protein
MKAGKSEAMQGAPAAAEKVRPCPLTCPGRKSRPWHKTWCLSRGLPGCGRRKTTLRALASLYSYGGEILANAESSPP